MIFTSFAWGPKYLESIERLRSSGHEHGIPMDLHKREGDEPSCPGAAKRLKPQVILFELLVHESAVWLDADGVFRGNWDVELRGDIMASRNRGRWETCTLWFSRSDRALAVLELWRMLMPAEFTGFDSSAFADAVYTVQPEIHELPPEYYWVKDWHFSTFGNRSPVIEYNVPLIKEGCCV